MPVAVCHGVGGDQSAANNAAARNALEYLKIMVKKSTTQNQGPKNGASDTNGTKVAGKQTRKKIIVHEKTVKQKSRQTGTDAR